MRARRRVDLADTTIDRLDTEADELLGRPRGLTIRPDVHRSHRAGPGVDNDVTRTDLIGSHCVCRVRRSLVSSSTLYEAHLAPPPPRARAEAGTRQPWGVDRTAVQILGGILLRAAGNQVERAATDMELSLRTPLDAAVSGDGAVVVPGKLFADEMLLQVRAVREIWGCGVDARTRPGPEASAPGGSRSAGARGVELQPHSDASPRPLLRPS